MGVRERMFEEVRIPTESVVLIIAGTISVTASALFLPISWGRLPYYENGFLGLLMFVMAVQIVILGKSPFGDVKRDSRWILAGAILGGLGVATCFIPGFFGPLPRLLVAFSLGIGGATMFLRMCLDGTKMPSWMKSGGVLVHLVVACGATYLLSTTMGLSLFFGGLFSAGQYTFILAAYGSCLTYLSFVLIRVYRDYPPDGTERACYSLISPDEGMLLLVGVFLVLLGLFLIPVNLGLLPFSRGAQLGLLMVVFSVQMSAFGNSPLGAFTRSPAMVFLGLICAVLGTSSCMIPDLLVVFLSPAVGFLNLMGGGLGLAKLRKDIEKLPDIPILRKLKAVQAAGNIFSILFGISMLVSGLLPGVLIGVILALNGATLLYLLRLLVIIEGMKKRV